MPFSKAQLFIMPVMSFLFCQSSFAENKEDLPDEAFLEFLASMSDIDGVKNDPLDMLLIEEQSLLVSNENRKPCVDSQDVKVKDTVKSKPKEKMKSVKQESK